MAYDYFHYTQLDREFYETRIRDRLPRHFLDAHTHINLQEHIRDVPPERVADDWALQTGLHMSAEDAKFYYDTLFPGKDWAITAFPFPIKEVHLEDNNDYVARCVGEGKIAHGLMCIKPEYTLDYIEAELTTKRFSGVKPYPDMVSGKKGSEIGIFQFLPHEQLALVERLGMPVVMHLPRAGRMPDDGNIRELKEIRQKYPDLKMIIAHCGRCFTPYHFDLALTKLGEDVQGFHFDTAAVLNPAVLGMALERLRPQQILYGTDEPIFLWHGQRAWTETTYQNLAREDFPWNQNHLDPETEAHYTFFVYRQLDNLLNEMDRVGLAQADREAIFSGNAHRIFGR